MNIAADKLSEWLKTNKVLKGTFAKDIGVGAPMVSRLLNRERRPSLQLALRISLETGGVVQPRDWLNGAE